MTTVLPLLYDYVLPTGCLPNGQITEFGIISYLNSLYSNQIKNNNFFDPTETRNPCQYLFNGALGSWPNSTSGTHLNSNFYYKNISIEENSVYFGKKKYEKYIYPIKISPHLDDFIGHNLVPGSKLNGEYFWKHISDEVLKDVKQKKAVIFLDYAQENFIEKSSYSNLHEILRLSGIPKEQIVLAFNSLNAQEVYESWFMPAERRLEVISWPFVMTATSYHYNQISPDVAYSTSLLKMVRYKERSNYFLFKIRRPRQHRLVLFYALAAEGLLEKADWSCLSKIHYDQKLADYVVGQLGVGVDPELIKNLISNCPKSLESESYSTLENVSAWTDQNLQPYLNSYFYVCTETFIHGPHKSLTEKVFKPIANFQPFLFLAYPGALKVLRNLGFKTFYPFINESYDDEVDENKRISLLFAEVKRLCQMGKKEIHEWYYAMEDILRHNKNHLLQLHLDESKSQELLKFLQDKIAP